MNLRAAATVLLFVACLGSRIAAADAEEPKSSMKDVIKARLADEAKNQPRSPAPGSNTATKSAPATSHPASPNSTAPAPASANPLLSPGATPIPTDSAAAPKPSSPASVAAEPPTVLPKMEVRKGRITELDRQLAQQEKEIAREKEATKSTEVDKALNDSKLAKPLAIFGGESTQFREHVASVRVSLMEDEKDLIEAIAHAKTKAEKAELQKQLDELRTQRRELEKSLR